MSKSKERFAFGRNKHDECYCPAMSVGKDPIGDNELLMVVTEFDTIAQERKEYDRGIIGAEEAEEIWLEAIDIAARHYGGESPEVKKGETVAEELGWL